MPQMLSSTATEIQSYASSDEAMPNKATGIHAPASSCIQSVLEDEEGQHVHQTI